MSELKLYKWEPSLEPKPLKLHDHDMDFWRWLGMQEDPFETYMYVVHGIEGGAE